ncbi:hypothetical protein ACLB1G_02685 [Oxalobacteraceae bacterium A2-2]
MPLVLPFPIRVECPPGACECGQAELLQSWEQAPDRTDIRVLRLNREEEKRLIAKIESITSYAELGRLEQRMQELLGVTLEITPSARGVRTVRGLSIVLAPRPGLCRKTRQAIPAAIRRSLDRHPEIVYALLNARDLLADLPPPAHTPLDSTSASELP